MASENETMADIVAVMRHDAELCYDIWLNDPNNNSQSESICEILNGYADRIEAAWKRERELLRSCARWILTHDIYGHMAQELLAQCKEVLGDDGNFLTPKGDMA